MIFMIVIFLISALTAWYFDYLNLIDNAKTINGLLAKIVSIITGRFSDHWKEKVIFFYSFRLFKLSLLIVVKLLTAGVLYIGLLWLSNLISGNAINLNEVNSPLGLSLSLSAFVAYSLFIFFRKKTKDKGVEYSKLKG